MRFYRETMLISLKAVFIIWCYSLNSKHRILKKNYETEMWLEDVKIPLNHFVQETLANLMIGFLKTLKGVKESPMSIKLEIKKLPKQIDVDGHNCP
jgi:hypothetical protein